MIRPLFASLLAMALTLPGPAAAVETPAPQAALAPATAPFTIRRSKIFITAIVQGQSTEALLDSGADFSVVDTTFAVEAGLTPGIKAELSSVSGKVSTQIVPAVSLEIPGQIKVTMPMLSADLSAVSAAMGRPVHFLLGGDILRKLALELRFSDSRFRLLRSGAKPNGYSQVPVYIARFASLVPVEVQGQKLLAQIDLGASNDIRISPEAWDRIKPVNATVSDSRSRGINGQATIEGKARLPHLKLGPFDEQNLDVRIAPMPAHLQGKADALIGLGIFTRYDLLLDVAAGTLWMRPRAGVLPRRIEKTGLALSADGMWWLVTYVSTKSPAAAAGWKAGDRICRVDGAAPNMGREPDWAYGPEGSTVKLGLCGDGGERQLTLHAYY